MTRFSPSRTLAGAAIAAACVAACAGAAPAPKPKAMPLAEARQAVRMMNDIYFAGVLTTHKMYVQEPGTAAAVTWAKQVIRQVREKGWPDARIFDTTGRPLNPENSPKDVFEEQAAAAFKAGKAEIEKVEPGRYRFAAPIRIVDESCITCHPRSKVGDIVGGVSYEAVVTPASRR